MTRKNYNKLIRDRIPEIIEQDGRQYKSTVMPEAEYRHLLGQNLIEEATEVSQSLESTSDLTKEIADLYEVIDSLIAAYNLDRQAILDLQRQPRATRVGFTKRLKLLWTD